MRILGLQADLSGCGFYRMVLPYRILGRRGHDILLTTTYTYNTITYAPGHPCEVIVVQRPGSAGMLTVLAAQARYGIPVVVEVDDLLWNIPAMNPAFRGWNTKRGSNKQSNSLIVLKEFMRRCDAVTVSTAHLRQEVLALYPQKPVYVLPNCLATGDWPDVDHAQRWAETGIVTFGWGGSTTHHADLLEINGLPGQALARYDYTRLLLFGGYKKAHELLGRGFPGERISEAGWLPLPALPETVSQLDVGLAPVESGRFNLAKSPLKALEFGICGVPTIASGCGTYDSFVRHGENGFLCRSPRDWLRAMDVLATDHPKRVEMGARARQMALSFDIAHHAHRWEEALAEVVERKAMEVGRAEAKAVMVTGGAYP